MDKKRWKTKIKAQMKAANTYQKFFDPTIETLAEILQQRDAAYEDFIDGGAEIVVESKSDRGAINLRKNPKLQIWSDLNNQALAFWRDCGLTPAGLKKINEAILKEDKKGSSLEEALKKLSG